MKQSAISRKFWKERTPTKTYQDQWIKGKLRVKGTRECGSRYEIIKSFCSEEYGKKPFSVLDIGANMLYFGIRLCEDFPNVSVLAFEYDHFEMREAHLKKNQPIPLVLIDRRLHIEDLITLNAICRFDVILILNVLHHVGNEFDDWLLALRELGNNIIGEFATSDSRSRKQAKAYRVPENAQVIGHGQSHIKKWVQRPIVHIAGMGNNRSVPSFSYSQHKAKIHECFGSR